MCLISALGGFCFVLMGLFWFENKKRFSVDWDILFNLGIGKWDLTSDDS